MTIFIILITLLCLLLITFVLYMIKEIRKKSRCIDSVNDRNEIIEKAILRKWHGDVRFPAGYYKSKDDFYKIERDLSYSKKKQ